MKDTNIKWDTIFYGRQWVSNIIETIQKKDVLQSFYLRRYLLRAMMAGFIISIITVFVLTVKTTFAPDVAPGLVNMAGAFTFSFALVLILFTNSELLTSNFMYFTVGLYYHLIRPTRVIKIFTLCFVGNMIGAFILFSLLRFSNVMTPDMLQMLDHTVQVKIHDYSFQNILVRAIFANFFINIALVIAMQIDDVLAKMFVMMFGVTIFAFMGYEHVVYNACLFIASAIYQTDAFNMLHMAKNIIGALLGNYIGGGLIIGLFYAYLNDHGQFKAIKKENKKN
ncbi:formate/nitrite transporter family protein [Staphylococcus pseudintermedius]|uniref:Formate/nitrite transporter n=1 Tax=Staphylococcus pseudintermedius TaxID=283734 RepID=A0A8H9BUJ1_STAPS|nr:formate/nitrite transporter family protein [Staphylococcus pseudintermedius]EGQ0292658.1 formate/nitrite transporter family protein [Staphylococcus pseudintermedius]EGQ0294290.1 formate/nitrite transporter family protein [Staphylococcus pseudintermedius]EGQ0299520.1 formate/nitrite transporter family protein [Staphylococcus pseudintermedius]EGQ0302678.1 formate/nitrite transporter family protein [Staphylococcus pseudintermedius]EGQ0307291.1 formate/nitrite transporter family protein [Staphy